MIQFNQDAFNIALNAVTNDAPNRRLQQEKQQNDALHQQLMRQLQTHQQQVLEQKDIRDFDYKVQQDQINNVLAYQKAGFNPNGTPMQQGGSNNGEEIANKIFAGSGTDMNQLASSSAELNRLYKTSSERQTDAKGTPFNNIFNQYDRKYTMGDIEPSMFASRDKLLKILNSGVGEDLRKTLKNNKGIALNNREWEEYKGRLLNTSGTFNNVVNAVSGMMIEEGIIPKGTTMDLKTQNNIAEALLSDNPVKNLGNFINTFKAAHNATKGEKNNVNSLPALPGYQQAQTAPQNTSNQQQIQNATPQEQAQQRQQIQQQIQNATPEERGQIRQELSMKQNAPTPEGIKQSVEDGQQIIESLQPKQKEYVDSNLEALMNGEKVVELRQAIKGDKTPSLLNVGEKVTELREKEKSPSLLNVGEKATEVREATKEDKSPSLLKVGERVTELKQGTKEDKTASMSESFLAGMGKVSRDLFNVGFKYGGVNLPPEERIEKMMADNPISAFLGEFATYVGLGASAVAAAGVGIGTVGGVALSLGISALMHGAATADTINAEDYNNPLSLTWDLVKPNSVADGLLTYGLPIAIEGGFAAANKISKSAKAKGAEIAEKAIKAEENASVAAGENLIKDTENIQKAAKKEKLNTTEENLMQSFESKAPEELHNATQQTYINKTKPMEQFGNVYKEELSKIPTKQEKLAIINKLDEMAIEGDTSFNQFQNRAVANKMGQLREDIQGAKTYDDILKAYRNINKEFDTNPESFYNRVGKYVKEDIREQLNNITGGKFNEANKAYEEAMLMDNALGLSKRMKNNVTGSTKKSDLINREITEQLRKTIDNPKYSGIRSLLAGGEEGLQQYTVGKIANAIKSSNDINKISSTLDKIANDFDSVLSKGGKASEAFTVARSAVDSIKELDSNIGRVISDLSKKIGNRSVDVPELLTKLEELSNKFNVGEFDGGISLRLADKFLNNVSDGLNGVGEKYFGMNWDSVKAKVMTSIAEGKPIDKGIREGLDKLNRTNVMRGILEAELKTKPILQDFGTGSWILDQITHHASTFLKVGKTLANKAIYEPSVKRTIAEEFAKRGKVFIEPEIQNLLNIDSIARASLNISRGLIQRKMLMDILKGQRGALYAASADLGAQQN